MKKFRLLGMTLALALLLLQYVGGQKVYAANTDYLEDGDVVTFGSYPQTLVSNNDLIDELDQVSKTWEKYPYYSKNTSPKSSQVANLNYSLMEYADFYYGNQKYRAVRILKYRPTQTVDMEPGDAQHSRQDDYGYTTNYVYYFSYDPIRWLVLSKGNGILISEKELDSQPFNATYTSANNKLTNNLNSDAKPSHYYYSTLRHWLNGISDNYTDYYDFNFIRTAFSSSERRDLRTRQMTFTDGTIQKTTSEAVFLLSKSELENYRRFADNPVNVPSVPTDYSEAQGCSAKESWWLSDSSTTSSTEAYYVYRGSDLPYGDPHFVGMTIIGVRPAIKVDLSSSAVVAYPKLVLDAQVDDDHPVMRWDAYPGAQKYVIECNQSTDPDQLGGWYAKKELSSSTLTYSDTGTLPENSYHYRLRVKTSKGDLLSAPVRFDYKLPVPIILVNSDENSGKPYIQVGRVSYADEYTIWRCYDGTWDPFVSYNSVFEDDYFRYEDSTAVTGREYGYEVRAKSTKNSIYNSDISIARYVKCVPAKVTSIKKTDNEYGSPKLSWNSVSGAKGYRIMYRLIGTSTWSEAYTKNSYYVIPYTEPGMTYQYRVYAALSETDKTFDSAPATGSCTSAGVPDFITWPQNVVAFEGGSEVILKVIASGIGVTYDWLVERAGYEDVGYVKEHSCTNGEWSYKPDKLDDGATYYVRLTDQFGRKTWCNTHSIAILSQPKNKTASVGDVAEITVTTCVPDLVSSYQWQSRKDSSSAWSNSGQPGAKTATLKVTTSAGLHGWQFRCVVKDKNGHQATSEPMTLTVVPKITTQPKNAKVPVGDIAEFTVAAAGKASLSYQWQSRKDSSSAWSNSGQQGAKTATLKVKTSAGLHGWQFRCVVTDGNGKQKASNAAKLSVVPKFTTNPKSVYAAAGSTAKFTVAATGKAPLSYQWQSRKDASSAWTNSGQQGAKTATLSVAATNGLNGWQFRCVVTDENGMSWGSGVATLYTQLSIRTQPKNTTTSKGSKVQLTIEAYGKASLSYQWQSRKNSSSEWTNSALPGAKTATLDVTATAGLNGYQFRCIVTDGNGKKLPSKEATLTVK